MIITIAINRQFKYFNDISDIIKDIYSITGEIEVIKITNSRSYDYITKNYYSINIIELKLVKHRKKLFRIIKHTYNSTDKYLTEQEVELAQLLDNFVDKLVVLLINSNYKLSLEVKDRRLTIKAPQIFNISIDMRGSLA